MIIIDIRFISGRYHATPWGRFPNEGIQEWPPSPYRLLRAIIAAWKYNLPEFKEEHVRPIIQKLASEPPMFYLPDKTEGHTRHYMPPYKGNTNLIMDAFLRIDKDDPVRFIWNNTTLDEGEKNTLKKVLENLHYFGRSESWCEARLDDHVVENTGKNPNCRPYDINTPQNNPGAKIISVMIPKHDVEMEHLYRTTDSIRNKMKKIYPDGAETISYILDKESHTYSKGNNNESNNIQVVRYAIGNTVKPIVTETLGVAETMRRAVMSKFGEKNESRVSATLTGKDENGKKAVGHKHAFYLPTDEDGDGRIDHIMIIVKNTDRGLRPEIDALEDTKKLWSYFLEEDIQLVFEGYGMIEDFPEVPILKKSKRWTTATPLVLSRHIKYKKKGKEIEIKSDSPEEQIRNEIIEKYDAKNVKIKFKNPRKPIKKSRFRPFQFKRLRKNDRPGGGAYNLTLEFDAPIKGPITLGYGSHFGLGMFVPDVHID